MSERRRPVPPAEPIPAPATMTVRQRVRAALEPVPRTAKELGVLVGASEREVEAALASLAEAPRALFERFPARCVACGHEFSERARVSRPSRCPSCRSERIRPPRFASASSG